MNLQEIGDRLAINELLARYCHALDRKDWPAFRAVFTENARIDFTAFGGPEGNPAELEAFLAPILDGLVASQHMVSTIIIDLDGNEAQARSAAIVPMTSASAEGAEQTLLNGLWYEDRLVRTPAGWRIAERRQVRGWVAMAG
ncbi:SnoaL-like domain-containing protein [Sphingomonas laterariae]|uniref:SnoaL-like domain-containing protein n=1 Tax=Edaphosphingomonas laterariae TaxID=861865 RepID=A0A239BQI5_9SPHN|nr:nuclear transport factor 2 family protein [Sphingomonas laterariae]SNS09668.1 SnoaL-like domain-containing protein [Sphingomonas laterariae]